MSEIDYTSSDNTLILPKVLDLSKQFSISPSKNSFSKKYILKLDEKMTSPKLNNISKRKINFPSPLNFKKINTLNSNDLLTERINSKKESILFSKYFSEKKEEKKKKYFELNSIFKTNFKSKNIKRKIKDQFSSPPPFKISKKNLNIKSSSNLLKSKYNYSHLKTPTDQITISKLSLSPKNYKIRYKEDILTQEIADENYDTFSDKTLEEIYILKVVTDFLRSKDNKLNQTQHKNIKFFNSLENRINFNFDIIGVPCFKNHFIKFNGLENISNNLVETGIISYLNKLRVIYQLEHDEKEKRIKLEELEKELEKNKKKKEVMDEFKNAEDAFKENVQVKKKVEKIDEIDYDTEDYFTLKFVRFSNVSFAGIKEKKALANLIDFKKKSRYRHSILNKVFIKEH